MRLGAGVSPYAAVGGRIYCSQECARADNAEWRRPCAFPWALVDGGRSTSWVMARALLERACCDRCGRNIIEAELERALPPSERTRRSWEAAMLVPMLPRCSWLLPPSQWRSGTDSAVSASGVSYRAGRAAKTAW